jgi:hypothetical protein
MLWLITRIAVEKRLSQWSKDALNHLKTVGILKFYNFFELFHFPIRQLGTSYVFATSGALVAALGLNTLVKVRIS